MLSGVATSQTTSGSTGPSPVLNSQINLGEIFSEQTLNVQTVSDGGLLNMISNCSAFW